MGDRVADAVAARPGAIVAVACPGGAVQLVVDEVVRSLGAAHAPCTVRAAGRTGRIGELGQPAEGEVLVIAEAQWVADEVLAEVSEPSPDGGAIVLVHRRAPATGRLHGRSLAVALLGARRNNAAFTLGPTSIAELRSARGVSAADAQQQIALTGGRADLLAALELDGDLVQDVSARLSVVDPTARFAAELIAFGLDAHRLATLLAPDPTGPTGPTDPTGSTGAAEVADTAVATLVAEGILDVADGDPVARDGHGGSSDGVLALPEGVAVAVRAVTTGGRRAAVIEALSRDDAGVLVLDLAARLDAIGDRTPAAGEVYRRAAERLAALDPAPALHWIERARSAGVAADSLVLAEATAAVGAGDPQRALATAGDGRRSDLALVRAAAWVALGDLEAAASCLDETELHPLGTWARVGAGVVAPPGDPTTDPSRSSDAIDAATTLVEAVTSWVAGDRDGCTDAVRRALVRHRAADDADRWPTTPDVVGALLHAQQGDVDRAERLLADALAEGRGGRAQRHRHLLVAAWLAAGRGRLDDASRVLDDVDAPALPPHEALWRAGVMCSIAVRDPEPDSLAPAAFAALAAADRCGSHLYDLGIVTDIAAAAARTGSDRTDELLAPAERMVARLGSPPSLVADLAWARLRVALCCDDPVAVAAAARTLAALPTAAHQQLRLGVARALVAIDDGRIDAAEVEDVSRSLADGGAPHEAARLCGIAAVRTTNESDARRLLKHSRLFRAQRAQLKRADHVDRSVVRLSEQETRVAQLVLEGHTHRQIGATLFISAKTVEHHVAHIRTKLGAGSRAEMLSALRAYLDGAN